MFFYLSTDEQGKTSSSFHWQTSFSLLLKGEGNLSSDSPKSFDFSFASIVADQSSPSEVLLVEI